MRPGTVQPDHAKVRRLRLAKELTQEELSSRAGCSKKTIENIEKGKPCLPVMLGAVAGQLGTTLTDLIVNPEPSFSPTDAAAHSYVGVRGSSPPLPSFVVGRDDDLRELKQRLRRAPDDGISGRTQSLVAIHGWPGVGKSTVAATLAHDAELIAVFPDGVLWTSLGPTPDLLGELVAWGHAVGHPELLTAASAADASRQLAAHLRQRRFLLIVDDVWQAEHGVLFRVGGRHCATLVTTRSKDVAHDSAPTPGDVYKLDVLDEAASLELLRQLAPDVVNAFPADSAELVRALEHLPLAIQVAGRLLQEEHSLRMKSSKRRNYVRELLVALRDAAALLAAQAPADMMDLTRQTIPTVAALLFKSVESLDPETRERFAFLSPAAPKPASFDFETMHEVWEADEKSAAATVRTLVARGLLEPIGDSRFQMHALLVALARSLCEE